MALDNDYLKALHEQMKYQSYLMQCYIDIQTRKARETPGITKLTTYNLLNPTNPGVALQIVPKNDSRESVALTSASGGDALIAEEWFDPTTALQWFSDPTYPDTIAPGFNQAIPLGFLAAGASLTLDGTMGVWAYALGSASSVSTIISIADSLYVTSEAKPDSQVEALHLSGMHPSEQPGSGLVK